MKPYIKICGIRTVEDAQAAAAAGADFIGLNFVVGSKREITKKTAKKIIDTVGSSATPVGIFRNQPAEYVNGLIRDLNLAVVQLHGSESPEYCRRINAKVMKAFPLEPEFDPIKTAEIMCSYDVSYYLADRKIQGKGRRLNLKKAASLAAILPIFIAGGLTTENISEVIHEVKPFGVDVAGGVETDGQIDREKVKNFINAALDN